MPPVSSRRSIASFGSTSTLTSARPIVPPVKLLQSYSTLNLASSPASPSASLRLQHSNNASPSSSGGASGVSVFTRSRSSATSSTLTAGSDRKLGSLRDSSSSTPQPQLPPINGSNFLAMHPSYHRFTQSPSSHTRSRGGSSKDTSSTLTPMTAHTPRSAYTSHGNRVSPQPTITVADDDDLSSILKVLSLERYQPIFEEQEVDMEAFLTLTENDLQEIGISQETSRNQILSAISELNSGKGRERQNYQEYMSQFDTMYLRNAGSDTADCWSMQEDETRPTDTSKSCVS
ncbi:hypothetical protein LSAT2_029021 [Lamellibrachia satsuma]|nr:hypothetical protein LSAT2_029021 [Lamellibrachia satsuma]